MKIRKARKEDLKEVAKILMEESVKKPYNEKFTPGSAKKDVLEFFKDSLYVATDGEKIIGFIASHIVNSDKTKAYIDELWIRSNYQGKGAGKILVKFIEEIYKKKGLSKIRLTTKKKAKSYSFYKKLKYIDADLVYMEKRL
ncbi:MAG: GNAT family N-acetyltransferase [Nanoarchaeota archaeon]|nr:GNAT family N-acetyltransferase [Nanoarchaeota archaeon]